MYMLYRLGSISHNPDALWLSYEWNGAFENREWRPCVENFLEEVTKLGHKAVPLSVPPFIPSEDFVEIVYLIDGVRTTFTSDLLLSPIRITSEDPRTLRSAWETIGNKVGWARA
jgi:hypothetical protein